MEYNKFKKILHPAMEILIKQNSDFQQEFGERMFTLQKASEVDIVNFEKKYKISIPKFYRDFLKEYNPFRLEIMFHGIFGLKDIEGALDYLRNKFFDPNYLPIASDNCGNYFGIISDNKTIFISNHEEGFELMGFSSIENFFGKLVQEKLENNNQRKN